MTKIDLDLAVKLDGSETHMLAVLVDSWGDKLVVPMMADTNIEGANYFTPCAHCGNAVLDCNFENGSDCCDRCNEGKPYLPHPKRKLESGQCVDLGYHEDQTEEIMQMMSECVHTDISTCTGTCWISDICVKRDELRKNASIATYITSGVGKGLSKQDMDRLLLIHTLPEDLMNVKEELVRQEAKLAAAKTELKAVQMEIVKHPSEEMKVVNVTISVVVNRILEIEKRIEIAREAAEYAFWDVIAKSFPDANDGSFLISDMEDIMLTWVKHWVDCNVPKKECYRGEIGYFDDLHLHYRDVWHQLHTGGGCMVAVTDNIAIDGSYRYMGVTSECVCIYTDTFEEGDFLQEHMEDCAWSYGENPTTLMNIIDEAFGGSALWNTGHLFDDIMTLGKSGKC